MPFYRVNGLMCHINMGRKNAPAPCSAAIELDGKRERCCGISLALCDWETGPGQTCSRPVCAEHQTHIGEDLDLCPEHAARRREVPGNQAEVV